MPFEIVSLIAAMAVAPANVVGKPDDASPHLRLTDSVRAIRQSVDLQLDPKSDSYHGSVEIAVELKQRTGTIWLNALDLRIDAATVSVGAHRIGARAISGEKGFAGIALDEPLGPGPALLHLAFEGRLTDRDDTGLVRHTGGDDAFVYSMFEPIGARRAFPCFDEPALRIPWHVALSVPKGSVALANSPLRTTTENGDGRVRFDFADTPSLPSYLVAIGVGPFEFVDLGRIGRKGTPARIVVPLGQTRQARWAAESTPRLLALLEDYLERPYPFEKLDILALPAGATFGGAMEHPGLMTYNPGLILRAPEDESIAFRRSYANITAHELAHQWFGNLVTLAWWDDIWLNESFASWLGPKIAARFGPDWDLDLDRVQNRSYVLTQDALATARSVRQPIESEHDIMNAFDDMSYGKGAAVLEMFEAWLGADPMRRGVQLYLDRHAWGAATAQSFLAAMSQVAGRDVAPAFLKFLDQPGAPILTAELDCSDRPRLLLKQRVYLPLGSRGDASRLWQLPLCASFGDMTSAAQACGLVEGAEQAIELPTKTCPSWFYPNANAAGYFRVRVPVDRLKSLLNGGRLSTTERLSLMGDVEALISSGDVPAAEALALAASVAQDSTRHVITSAQSILESVSDLGLEQQRTNFEAFVRAAFAERARALGWSRPAGESDEAKLLRIALLRIAGGLGADQDLVREARPLVDRWLADPTSIDPDLVDVALRIVAPGADRALLERMKSALSASQDPTRRMRIVTRMGIFRDPALVREALDSLLAQNGNRTESLWGLASAISNPSARDVAWTWFEAHYPDLVTQVPEEYTGYLPLVTGGFCDTAHRASAEAFFRDKVASLPGGPRNLAQALEAIDLCIAKREAHQPSVVRFLEEWGRSSGH